jgi:hypothetical protein
MSLGLLSSEQRRHHNASRSRRVGLGRPPSQNLQLHFFPRTRCEKAFSGLLESPGRGQGLSKTGLESVFDPQTNTGKLKP